MTAPSIVARALPFFVFLGLGGAALRAQAAGEAVDADLLLAGATIVDGTGGERFTGDVAIKDDRIVAVGDFAKGAIVETIDCQGLVVTPGYIDLHSHSDRSITDPSGRGNINFLMQGCTTVVTGNCGAGPVDVAKYFADVDAAGAGTHVIHLLPQGSLRQAVFGSQRRAPTAEELEKMKALADQAMRDGAWGMSTGLIYVPGTYCETEELIEIARVVSSHGGLYCSHIRNEAAELIEAVNEAIRIGREAALPVHISHYKANGRASWGGVRVAAAIIEKAQAAGQKVSADQYPYIASSTSLMAMTFPSWALEGGQKEILRRLDEKETARSIRAGIRERLDEGNRLVVASYQARPEWVGKSIDDIAAAQKIDPVEVVVDIQRHGGASAVSFGMNEDDVRFAMQLPWVATASDGSAQIPSPTRPHPRSYGTFSRKIGHYALGEKVITLEHAVRSASALPAEILGLKDRGTLTTGMIADLVVFDPNEFLDQATFDEPFKYSKGLRYVFVAGKPAVYEGAPTGALYGKAIRHVSAKATQAHDSQSPRRD